VGVRARAKVGVRGRVRALSTHLEVAT
jgi:hypothetical protein